MVGVSEAHLEDVITKVGDLFRRTGRGQHKDLIRNSLRSNGRAGTGGNGTGKDLHTVILQGVIGVQSLFVVVLVVLGVKFDLQTVFTGRCVDLFHSDLHTSFNGNTVNGSAAGQRTGHTNSDGIGVMFLGATGKQSGYHQSSQQNCEYFFHFLILLILSI